MNEIKANLLMDALKVLNQPEDRKFRHNVKVALLKELGVPTQYDEEKTVVVNVNANKPPTEEDIIKQISKHYNSI